MNKSSRWILIGVILLLAVGCEDSQDRRNGKPRIGGQDPDRGTLSTGDVGSGRSDGGRRDMRPNTNPDSSIPDIGMKDLAVPDMAPLLPDMAPPPPDMAPLLPDMALPPPDMAPPPPDMAPPPPDMAPPPPDMAPPVPPGRTQCSQGEGFALFKLRWNGNNRSARVDVWDMPCEYSFNIGGGCGASAHCTGGRIGCEAPLLRDGIGLDSGSHRLVVRYDVTGIQFNTATVYLRLRAVNGISINFSVESPRYGGFMYGPIQARAYEWFALDALDFVQQGDDPGLTAFIVKSTQGRLGVAGIELCVH